MMTLRTRICRQQHLSRRLPLVLPDRGGTGGLRETSELERVFLERKVRKQGARVEPVRQEEAVVGREADRNIFERHE
jgi:hypothetical protein